MTEPQGISVGEQSKKLNVLLARVLSGRCDPPRNRPGRGQRHSVTVKAGLVRMPLLELLSCGVNKMLRSAEKYRKGGSEPQYNQ